jgi:invasion protein IalB
MNRFFNSKYWAAYAAGALLILLSLAAAIMSRQPAGPRLPPIADVQIKPGFLGNQRFGLWTLSCENPKQQPPAAGAAAPTLPKRLCRVHAQMMLRVAQAKAPLLAGGFNIVTTDLQAGPGMVFRLPPSAGAADSINFFIDKNTMFKVPLQCSQKECLARGALPAPALEQLRAGRTLSVVYTIKDRSQQARKVRIDQLLHGFPEGYDAMMHAMSR